MAHSTLTLVLMAHCLLLLSFCSQVSFAQIGANTISAAPALLPTISSSPPLSSPSPALSPDITPLFPSPSGSGLSPSESSLPTIPSSPSPPNPDDISTFGPNTMALSPSGSLPDSSSVSWKAGLMSLGACWAFQLMI
ncbi:classical arabinogalactan protein 26 [Artemisia annua]|uniref:Classical arabinogalactan protein 26 n=1 Tax=Artemisia annua TaxID=35608 RepID=A0A2U1M104_ARTAN|nr:classical arabinogalactan protein 26 [Artemisia annua]